MSRRRTLAVAGLAVAAGLAAVFVVAALHRPEQAGVRIAGRPVAALRSLTPTEPQFGDPVVATIELVVDQRRVDPRLVTFDARFTPFSVTSSTRSVRHEAGLTIVRVVDRLDCLDRACLPTDAAATFRFPHLQVAYPGGTLSEAWPAVRVHARLQAADLEHALLRVGPAQAHPSFRLPPAATGWTLLGVAIACALGGVALLLRPALPALALGRPRGGTPLEEILRELANGRVNGDAGRRRRTLEQLARELEPLDAPLAFESRVLAWAPQEPAADTIADLTRRVRSVVDG